MRLCAPKPMKPLITVAPARPRLRASRTMASYSGLPCHRSPSPTKMRRSLPSVGNDIGRPQTNHAGNDLPNHVDRCPDELSVANERKAFERVRGERREAAEDADEQEQPQVGLELHALFGGAGDHPEDDTPDDVD